MNSEKNYVYVTGFNKDINRKTLLEEFGKFGTTTKLYLHPTGQFAKVGFTHRRSAEAAITELNNSLLNWHVSLDKGSQHSNSSDMANYGDNYEDEDFTENPDYCNIHGQPLVVLQADSGDLYVNLKDIRKTGFAVFRRDTFDSVLVDSRQIGKEFELHLLSEAKNYILKNRVGCIDEERILKTIERCKNKLLGETTNNSFGAGRSVSQSSRNITITSNVEQSRSDSNFPMVPEVSNRRPPKTLPNNFMPTHTQRGGGDRTKGFNNNQDHHDQRGGRDSSRFNGFNASSSRNDNELNSSNSSDTKSSFKKPRGGFEPTNRTQRSSREPREEVAKISFEPGDTYEVMISYKEEKENICWIQDVMNEKQLEDVIIQINELVSDTECISPTQGQLVAAEYKDLWYRGRVINTDPLMVHFLDYGNKSGVDLVKALPDSLKSIPALAVRTVVNLAPELTEDMRMEVKIKKKYDDGTYVVDVLPNNDRRKSSEAVSLKPRNVPISDSLKTHPDAPTERASTPKERPVTPKPTSYFDKPEPLAELHNGDVAMLLDVEDDKFLVRTRDCATKFKTITDYIKNLDKATLILSNVKVGQLVLCSKDGFAGLFRGVVIKRENDLIVTVKYVDSPGEAELSVKSLRNVDEYLANEPSTILLTPKYKILEDLSEEGAEYVLKVCEKKQKFTVVLSKNNFDLKNEDGKLLSEILTKLKSAEPELDEVAPGPSSVKETPVKETASVKTPPPRRESPKTPPPKKEVKAEVAPETEIPVVVEEKVFYNEMDWIKIEPGVHTLMCYCLQDVDDITFLSSSDEAIAYLEAVTSVSPTEEAPYTPEQTEMCLVLFKSDEDDEASWYRAVVLTAEGGSFLVSFVDFGNQEMVQSKDIRKLPRHLKEIPILGVGGECVGIPKKPKILDRLKQLLPQGTQVEVLVKELDGLKYQIELPDIYKQLKSEKLF